MRTLGAIRIFVTTLLAGCAGATPRFAPDAPISVQLGSSRWKCAEAITALAASRDGALLAAGDALGDVHILDARDGVIRHAFADHTRRVRALAFSPDGALLASVGEDRRAVIRRVGDGAKAIEVRSPLTGYYNFAAAEFSPDGGTLVVGGVDAGLVVIDTASGAERARWDLATWGVASLRWTADGSEIVCGCGDGAVRVVDASTGAVARVLREPKASWSPWFAFAAASGSDGVVVAARQDGIVDRWDAAGEGGVIVELQGARLADGTMTDDGTLLLAARDGTLRRVDALSGRETAQLQVSTRALLGLALMHGGDRVAVAGEEGAIRILDRTTGVVLTEPIGHVGPATCVAPSPDGRRVVTGGRDGTVRLWDAVTGRELRVLHRGTTPVHAVAFSRDSALVAAGSHDGAVRRFSSESGAELGEAEPGSDPVRGIRATAGGEFEIDRGYPPVVGNDSHHGPDDSDVALAVARSIDGRMEWTAYFDGTVVGRPAPR